MVHRGRMGSVFKACHRSRKRKGKDAGTPFPSLSAEPKTSGHQTLPNPNPSSWKSLSLIDALSYCCRVGLLAHGTNTSTITKHPNSKPNRKRSVRLVDDGGVEAGDTKISVPFNDCQLCVCQGREGLTLRRGRLLKAWKVSGA